MHDAILHMNSNRISRIPIGLIADRIIVSEMTYTVSSGTLNSSIPYLLWRSATKIWLLASCLSRSLKVIGADTNRSATYDFVLVTMDLSYRFPDKKRYLQNSPITPVYLTPMFREFPYKCVTALGLKLEWCLYQIVKKLCRCVHSLGRTDGRTDGLAITISRCACIAYWRGIENEHACKNI